jgi:hypothetical protein
MSRRDPQRIIYAAQRARLRSLRGEWQQSEGRADELLNEWESEASTGGLRRGEPTCWDETANWIEDRIARR